MKLFCNINIQRVEKMRVFGWTLLSALLLLMMVFPRPTTAQNDSKMFQEEAKLTRAIIKLERRKILAANIDLTKKEPHAFWPIYDKYTSSMTFVNDQKFKLISEYRDAYVKKNLSEANALKLLEEFLNIERSKLNFKKLYIPRFKKVLPPKKVVRFYQVENKLDSIINYELSREIPLVPVK